MRTERPGSLRDRSSEALQACFEKGRDIPEGGPCRLLHIPMRSLAIESSFIIRARHAQSQSQSQVGHRREHSTAQAQRKRNHSPDLQRSCPQYPRPLVFRHIWCSHSHFVRLRCFSCPLFLAAFGCVCLLPVSGCNCLSTVTNGSRRGMVQSCLRLRTAALEICWKSSDPVMWLKQRSISSNIPRSSTRRHSRRSHLPRLPVLLHRHRHSYMISWLTRHGLHPTADLATR